MAQSRKRNGQDHLSRWSWLGGGDLVTELYPTLATPWTAAYQASLSMGLSRQEYWSGLPLPSPGECVYLYQQILVSSGLGHLSKINVPVLLGVEWV